MVNADKHNNQDEEIFINKLRAKSWDEFYGQETIKSSLLIALEAAKKRHEPIDHTLLYGPPGLGKTTLSFLIAKELGSNLKITSGTALSKTGDLAAILTNMENNDVLFIDEIHRLPKVIEETLYPAMEDYALDIVIGKGPSARTVRLDLPKFTLVGATTRFGLLTGPFRDRFGIIHRLDFYSPEKLLIIIKQASQKLNLELNKEAALELAKRSRGTPRIALKLLKRLRDYIEVKNIIDISPKHICAALEMLEIDELGLDSAERRMITKLIEKHDGGPVGLSTIAATINEDPGTIEEVLEPYLMQIGFIKRTPKGRVISPKAYQHLGLKYQEKGLF